MSEEQHEDRTFQNCPRCGVTTVRIAWGPGFVKCPTCLQFLPSASEARQQTSPELRDERTLSRCG